jgi:hypothetical protein
MWDLTVPGNNDHDFYVLPAQGTYAKGTSDMPVLVHNDDCPSGGEPRRYANGYGGDPFEQGVTASLNSKRILKFSIDRASLPVRGKQMFQDMMEFFGPSNVKGIDSDWLRAPGMTDNLDSFNAAINAGVDPEDAALNYTFSGKMAARWGFGGVIGIQMIGDPGNYINVRVQFRPPGG